MAEFLNAIYAEIAAYIGKVKFFGYGFYVSEFSFSIRA